MSLLGHAEDFVRKAVAAGADGAEVYMERDIGLDLDIENGAVASTGRDRSEGGALRVIKDGRIGFAFFTRHEDVPKTIERALKLSRLAPEKDYQFLPAAKVPRMATRWDDGIAALDVDVALQAARDMIQAVGEEDAEATAAGGGVGMSRHEVAIANSEGLGVFDSYTEAGLGINVVVADGERSLNTWDSIDAHVGMPDGAELARRVTKDALSLRGPKEGPSGAMDVVFRPEAAVELIQGLVVGAVLGDDAKRGKTVWSGKLGTDVAAPMLSVHDDPLRNGAVGVEPFDGDGKPVSSIPIIAHGELKNFLFDWRDATWHGVKSTGSAVRSGFKSPPSVAAHHLVVSGKSARPDEAIISGIDSGYLVESVLGAHTANATTGDFSVTAPNVWRIEKGELAGPASEIAIGGNFPALLKTVGGVGDTPKQMSGAAVPLLHLQGVQVST